MAKLYHALCRRAPAPLINASRGGAVHSCTAAISSSSLEYKEEQNNAAARRIIVITGLTSSAAAAASSRCHVNNRSNDCSNNVSLTGERLSGQQACGGKLPGAQWLDERQEVKEEKTKTHSTTILRYTHSICEL